MKTYLPFSDFAQCAACFSDKRLTKQRHDIMEILYMLEGRQHPTRGDHFMYNSPPKKVWQHAKFKLIEFGIACCDEYEKRRGGRPDPIRGRLAVCKDRLDRSRYREPAASWLGLEQMNKSHQAILARQEAGHYGKFGFKRDPEDEKVFYWPVEEAEADYVRFQAAERDRVENERRERDRVVREQRAAAAGTMPADASDDDSYLDEECDCDECLRRRDGGF